MSVKVVQNSCKALEWAAHPDHLYVKEDGGFGKNGALWRAGANLSYAFTSQEAVDAVQAKIAQAFKDFLDQVEAEGKTEKRFFYPSDKCRFEGGGSYGLQPYETVLERIKTKEMCSTGLSKRIETVKGVVKAVPYLFTEGVGSDQEHRALHDAYIEVVQALYCQDSTQKITDVQEQAKNVLGAYIADSEAFRKDHNIKFGRIITYNLCDRLDTLSNIEGGYSDAVKRAIASQVQQ